MFLYETSRVTQHFHVLVLFAGAFYLGIAVLCLCILINKFSVGSVVLIREKSSQCGLLFAIVYCFHKPSGHIPVFSFCVWSVHVVHLIWWACIRNLRLPFRKRATCNLLLVFVFTLSLCLHCPCVSFCICIFFIDFVSWRAGLHSKYLVVNLLGKLPPYHILHCICSCSCMCPCICVWTCICHCICICIF